MKRDKIMEQYNIGEKIRKLREQQGWTQRELAKKVNLSQSTIQDIEKNENKLRKLKTVDKFLDVFDISFDFLFRDYLTAFPINSNSSIDEQIKNELLKMDIKDLSIIYKIVDVIDEHNKKVNNNYTE